MAFAAVASLEQVLDQICLKDRFSIPYYQRGQIFSLLRKVKKTIHFLTKSSQYSSEEVKSLEIKIRDAAHHAEDVIESWQTGLQKRVRKFDSNMEEEEDVNITDLITEIDTLTKEMLKIIDGSVKQNCQSGIVRRSRIAPIGQTSMVGFGEDLRQIKDRLSNDVQQPKLQMIPIVGMGGIAGICVPFQKRQVSSAV